MKGREEILKRKKRREIEMGEGSQTGRERYKERHRERE